MSPFRRSPASDYAMLKMRRAGQTQRQIAKAIGCCWATVCARLEELRVAGVTTAIAQRLAAEAERKQARRESPPTLAQIAARPAQRRCLGGCGQMFESSYAGNRICLRCRRRCAAVSPFTPDPESF